MSHLDVLIVSRGLGLGHITRDYELYSRLKSAGCHCQIATYGGLQVAWMKMHGTDVIQLPGHHPYSASNMRAIRSIMEETCPKIVLSDEETYVATVAPPGIKSILITNWLPLEERHTEIELFNQFSRCVFADFPDSFPQPMSLTVPVVWVGPLVAAPTDSIASEKAGDTIIPVMSGGGLASDGVFWESVVKGLRTATPPSVNFALYAGAHKDKVLSLLEPVPKNLRERIFVKSSYSSPQEVYNGSPVAVSRSGHTTLWEAAVRGVFSVIVPRVGTNPMSPKYARSMVNRGWGLILAEDDVSWCLGSTLNVALTYAQTDKVGVQERAARISLGWNRTIGLVMDTLQAGGAS